MIPFASKEHILFIPKPIEVIFCGFEFAKCRSKKSFGGSKVTEQ
jgi:hypothetical protein